jgi:hypothetical protein
MSTIYGRGAEFSAVQELRDDPSYPNRVINVVGLPGMGGTAFLQALIPQGGRFFDINAIAPIKSGTIEQRKALLTQAFGPVIADENSAPRLILIDNVGGEDDPTWAPFENEIILPNYSATSQIHWVLRSVVPLRYRQSSVRRSVGIVMLSTFDTVSTKSLLHDKHKDRADAITEIAGGFPGIVQYLDDVLTIDPNMSDSNLASMAFMRFINSVGIHVKEFDLGLSSMLNLIGVCREFDVSSYRWMQRNLGKNPPSESNILQLIKRVGVHHLSGWSDGKRAYVAPDHVRSLIGNYMRLCKPEEFRKMKELSVKYYEELIKDVPGNRAVYIGEWLYALSTQEQPVDLVTTQRLVQSTILKHYCAPNSSYVDTKGVETLRQVINDDSEIPVEVKRIVIEVIDSL